MSVAKKILMAPSGIPSGYDIDQSLMFAKADTAYLHRTPGSTGNQSTWTWSGWVKRAEMDDSTSPQTFFGVGDGNSSQSDTTWFWMGWYDGGDIYIQTWSNTIKYVTNRKCRDPSAWYHVCVVLDTTESSSGDRVKLFLNGVQETSFGTSTAPSEDSTFAVNSTNQHRLGGVNRPTYDYLYDGYMAEVHFIDGTALTPTSFGETDSDTGQWIPKKAAGLTYGTNGFYCKFVSGALGTDSSGEGNNYTAVNLADTDVALDTPTNNFCTLNPIEVAGATLTQGNLYKASNDQAPSTFFLPSGKWYCEVALLSGSSTGSTFNYALYVSDTQHGTTFSNWSNNYVNLTMANGGNSPNVFGVFTDTNGTVTQPTGSRPDAVAIIGIAIDVDDGDVEYYINGTLNGKCLGITDWTPPVTVNLAYATSTIGAKAQVVNFGQNGSFVGNVTAGGNADGNGIGNFKYAPPTGYLAMCTSNLPTPTIKKPGDYFNTVIYTGNGSTQSISGVGFQPDLVWIKNRSAADNHKWTDAVRGVTEELESNSTDAEVANADGLTAFASDGFALGDDDEYNTNTENYVSWNWLAGGGSGSSNEDGSINTTSTSVNTTAKFSISTYTGTGSAATIGHGLGVAPDLIIVKSNSDTQSWLVYQSAKAVAGGSDPQTDYLFLNSTAALTDDDSAWNDTAPTSTVFSVGASWASNRSDETYVAYCWANVEGYSQVGTYEGLNSTDGPFEFTGFNPQWIMIKYVDGIDESWWIQDWKRNSYNVSDWPLFANLTSAESETGVIDFLSNGFKIRSTNGGINGNTSSYIYVAFADFPFKYSNAR